MGFRMVKRRKKNKKICLFHSSNWMPSCLSACPHGSSLWMRRILEIPKTIFFLYHILFVDFFSLCLRIPRSSFFLPSTLEKNYIKVKRRLRIKTWWYIREFTITCLDACPRLIRHYVKYRFEQQWRKNSIVVCFFIL